MSRHAVVVISDLNYVVPSTATALSARRNLSRPDIDVQVFVVAGSRNASVDAIARRLAPDRITVRAVEIADLPAWSANHRDAAVPVTALSRFWLHRLVDPDVERFLYLDGDVLVDAPLDPIFELPVPARGFLAADDCLCLYEHEIRQPRRYWEPYLTSIGVDWSDYFNSGVLLVDRSGWEDIAADALRFLLERPELCRSSDQTALNVVAGHLRGRLPLRWNYQTEHMMVWDPRNRGVQPAIWHFAASPKPWDLPEWPWGAPFTVIYEEARELLAGLDLPQPPVNRAIFDQGVAHRRRQRRLQRWRFLFRRYARARRIRAAI